MIGLSAGKWDQLEQWSPVAFIVGGIGILALSVAGALDTAAIAPSPGWLHALFMLGGLWFVYIGLLGLYPAIAESAPRLSLSGVVTSAIGWLALTVVLLGSVVIDLTTQRSFQDPGGWAPPFLVGAFVLVLISSLLYGIASVRSRQPSRRIGLLLFVPFATFLGQSVLLASKILTGDVLSIIQLVLAGLAGVALIAIGHLLRTQPARPGKADPGIDTTP